MEGHRKMHQLVFPVNQKRDVIAGDCRRVYCCAWTGAGDKETGTRRQGQAIRTGTGAGTGSTRIQY